MTNTALPIDASSGSPAYTSQQFRQAMSALVANGTTRPVGGRSGYGPGHQPTVLTVTSTTWTVGPFSAIVDPAFTTTQGAYFISADANNTGSVTAAPSSPNSRVDILYAQVNDTAIDSSGSRNFTVSYLAGTAGTSPAAPATPARSFLLATINVPSSPGTPTVTINNTFSGAAGSLVVCSSSSAYPASPHPYMRVYDMALGYELAWNGSAWSAQPAWTNANFGATGFQALGSPFFTPSYGLNRFGEVIMRGYVQNNSGSSKAAGSTMFTLPAGMRPTSTHGFVASDVITSGYSMRVEVKSDGTVIINNTGAVALANLGFVILDNVRFYAEQ